MRRLTSLISSLSAEASRSYIGSKMRLMLSLAAPDGCGVGPYGKIKGGCEEGVVPRAPFLVVVVAGGVAREAVAYDYDSHPGITHLIHELVQKSDMIPVSDCLRGRLVPLLREGVEG